MRWYWIIRTILILVPALLLGSFGYRYVDPDGELLIKYDFCTEETPFFSGLSPDGRVHPPLTKGGSSPAGVSGRTGGSGVGLPPPNPLLGKEGECYQRMVIDPVYFDVRLSQSYQTVEIEAMLDEPVDQVIQLGVGIDPQLWQWNFDRGMRNDELGIRGYKIDLGQAQFERHRYRFIVSAPGLAESGGEIIFYDMKLVFRKEPLSKENIGERLKRILKISH